MVPKGGIIIRIVLAKGSKPHAYVFSSCNEKVRALVVRGTTRTKEEIKSDEKYNLHQHNGNLGTHKGEGNFNQKVNRRLGKKRRNKVFGFISKHLLVHKVECRYIVLKWYVRGPKEVLLGTRNNTSL